MDNIFTTYRGSEKLAQVCIEKNTYDMRGAQNVVSSGEQLNIVRQDICSVDRSGKNDEKTLSKLCPESSESVKNQENDEVVVSYSQLKQDICRFAVEKYHSIVENDATFTDDFLVHYPEHADKTKTLIKTFTGFLKTRGWKSGIVPQNEEDIGARVVTVDEALNILLAGGCNTGAQPEESEDIDMLEDRGYDAEGI